MKRSNLVLYSIGWFAFAVVCAVALLATGATSWPAWVVVAIGGFALLVGYGTLESYLADRKPYRARMSVIGASEEHLIFWIPGVGTSGSITSERYRKMLSWYGKLWIVDYNDYGFNMDTLVDQIITIIRRSSAKKATFIGISLGGCVAMQVRRRLVYGSSQVRRNFIFDCTPPSGKYVRQPIGWTEFFHGPLFGFIYKLLIVRPSSYLPWMKQDKDDNVDTVQQQRHRQFRMECSGMAQLQQIRAINQMPVKSMTSSYDPALIIRTAGKDVLVRENEAADELTYLFPNSSTVRVMNDLHAGVVECLDAHRSSMENFIHEQADVPRQAS